MTECEPCGIRRYNNRSGVDACEFCPEFETTLAEGATKCLCEAGYLRDLDDMCVACPENTVCEISLGRLGSDGEPAENTIVELPVEPGYWRAGFETDVVRECVKHPEYCTGNVNGSLCLEHHGGAFCLMCDEGYANQGEGCNECTDEQVEEDRGTFLVGMLCLIAFMLLVGVSFVIWRLKTMKPKPPIDATKEPSLGFCCRHALLARNQAEDHRRPLPSAHRLWKHLPRAAPR